MTLGLPGLIALGGVEQLGGAREVAVGLLHLRPAEQGLEHVRIALDDKDWGYHDLFGGTWGKEARALGIDVKFFMGKSFNPYQSDEMHLNCPDDYDGLPFKTREICKWVSGKMVDFVFLCDTDTYLIPRLMLQTGFEKYDYAGKIDGDPKVRFKYDAVSRGKSLTT